MTIATIALFFAMVFLQLFALGGAMNIAQQQSKSEPIASSTVLTSLCAGMALLCAAVLGGWHG